MAHLLLSQRIFAKAFFCSCFVACFLPGRLPERRVLIVHIRLVHIFPTIWWGRGTPLAGDWGKELFKLSLLFLIALWYTFTEGGG